MYCPRCGQERVSEELRFCSRCGLPLNLVTEIVNSGGTLPQLAELSENKTWLTRNFGLKIGFSWLLVFSLFFVPLAAIFVQRGPGNDLIPLLFLVGFIGGILIAIFSLLFLKNKPKNDLSANLNQNETAQNLNLSAINKKNALPPQQSIPASDFIAPTNNVWKTHETGDLVQPPSVIEETTKLLEKDFEK